MTHNNQKYLEWCLEHDLSILADWFKANKLTLNVAKSVCMNFSHSSLQGAPLHINIDCITLPVATSFKLLGVWLDSKLTWQYHINQLLLKIKRNTQLLRTSQNMLNLQTKRVLYFAQIYSHFSYGIITWGNMLNASQKRKLEKTHQKCCRLSGKNNSLLSFDNIIRLQNMKLGFRLRHLCSHLPERIKNACESDMNKKSLSKSHRYNTRYKSILNLPKANCSNYKNSFLVRCITDYSSLPVELKSITNEGLFVKLCKYHLLL